jgi:hypothetical protein
MLSAAVFAWIDISLYSNSQGVKESWGCFFRGQFSCSPMPAFWLSQRSSGAKKEWQVEGARLHDAEIHWLR